jgi:AraC-like DNA-binding protein
MSDHLSDWNAVSHATPAMPRLFSLVAPEVLWDMLHGVAKATGLMVTLPLLEYYLDEERYALFCRDLARASEESYHLWFFLDNALGRQAWRRLTASTMQERPHIAGRPFVRTCYHGLLACAVAPIMLEEQEAGEITTGYVMVNDALDWQIHQSYARDYGLSWPAYQTASEHTLHMSLKQLDEVAELLGALARTIAGLASYTAITECPAASNQCEHGERQHWQEVTRQAIAFMQENLENPIGVAEVSRAVALTPTYFSTLFSQQVGCSPIDYLTELRLERARHYLTDTQMSVKEVGAVLGYSRSYFSRLFKRQVGCTPGQYARRARQTDVQHM